MNLKALSLIFGLIWLCGCSSVKLATPVAIRAQSQAIQLSASYGFTGSVTLNWQWPTNGNPAAFAISDALIQSSIDLMNWQTIALVAYTNPPLYSFNVVNSQQMFFRMRETIPGLF